VDVNTIEAVKEDSDIAIFNFRASSDWICGAHCSTKIKSFSHAKEKDTSHEQPFVMEGDDQPFLLSKNVGPNIVEAVHALASCLAVGFVYNADAQGINVKSLGFDVEGDVDLHAFLGLPETKRPSYENIWVEYRVNADAPKNKLVELCENVQKTSPILDIIRNPMSVSMVML
jgi:uncharacterized OsmC-like protein